MNDKLFSGELLTRRVDALARMVTDIRLLARTAGIPARLSGRIKTFESTWRKMHRRNIAYREVVDLIGIRVIVDSAEHCYRLLSHVRDRYVRVPGHDRDYIIAPKQNGYQSLHTTVRSTDGMTIEVQLRTSQMHKQSEIGRACHRDYKSASA